MTEVALAVPLDDARALVKDAPRYGHRIVAECSGADELANRIAVAQPGLVIAAATPQYLNARLVDTCDGRGIRLIVVGDGPAERRHAGALGVIDPVPAPASWAALEEGRQASVAASTPLATPSAATSEQRRGTVIAVWGPGGAPGRTSLAIAIAAEFAVTGLLVALADADTHGASVAPALGLLDETPGFAAACRLAGAGDLTPAEFDRISAANGASAEHVRVLTGLGRPGRWPELTAERVTAVAEAARSWSDVTVFDVAASLEQDEEVSSDLAAPRRNAATLAAVREADLVVAVASADPIGLSRFLRAHADLLEHTSPDRVVVVVNKLRSSAIGLDPGAQVRQTLARFGGIDDPALVPWDPAAFDAALLSGRSLVAAAPRSPSRAAIRRVVLERLSDRATRRRAG